MFLEMHLKPYPGTKLFVALRAFGKLRSVRLFVSVEAALEMENFFTLFALEAHSIRIMDFNMLIQAFFRLEHLSTCLAFIASMFNMTKNMLRKISSRPKRFLALLTPVNFFA